MNPYRNNENYYDPTAGAAISHLIREESVGKSPGYRPLTYIVSSYAGDIPKNTEAARRYCRFAVDQGRIPICSHLLYPQFLHEENPKEQELGRFFGKILMNHCKEVWIFSDKKYSAGMLADYEYAKRRGSQIRYFTTDCREIYGPGEEGADESL